MNNLSQMEALKELCGGFITKDVLEDVIRINRLESILVRCGGCRFIAPAQDVPHLLKIIGNSRDYVRDVSFPYTPSAESLFKEIAVSVQAGV